MNHDRTQLVTGTWLFRFSALFAVTLFLGQITVNTLVYPAAFPLYAGVALAALVLYGLSLAPAVFLGVVAAWLLSGMDVAPAVLIGLGTTSEALAGALVLTVLRFDPVLRRMKDVLLFVSVAVVVAAIAPTFAVYGARLFLGDATMIPASWLSAWVAHLFVLLVVAPFVTRWLARSFTVMRARDWLETALAFGALLVADYVYFWITPVAAYGISLVFVVLLPLGWIAMRLRPRFLSLALLLTALVAFPGIALTHDPLSAVSLGERLLQVQVLMVLFSVIFFILLSLENERGYATGALQAQIERLTSAFKRISDEDKAKTEFIAVLAHELRNPLAPILSGLELLKLQGTKAQNAEELVDMMRGRVNSMARLLDDLLDISRISHRKLTLKKENLDLRAIVKRSVRAIDDFSIHATHTLRLDIPDVPLRMEADPVRIEQVVVNLLKNAVKYTPPGGHVDVTLAQEGSMAVLRISDTGIGIEQGMLERIFHPFVQGGAHIERGGSGLGIGLALTRNIIELHEGSIAVESAGMGRGSTFTVRLPLNDAPTPPVTRRAPLRGMQPRTILIVDDSEPAAATLGKLMEFKGHRVDIALCGVEAIEMVRRLHPDIIFLDIGLPDMNGYEVAHVLRLTERYDGIIVAVTGFGAEDDREKAFDAGFDYHLTKPISFSTLEAILEKAVTSSYSRS